MRRLLQVLLLVAFLAAPSAVALLQERPLTLHGVQWSTPDGGTWDPDAQRWRGGGLVYAPENATASLGGRRVVVAMLQPLEYNATRDATLAGSLICSHALCGPLVWVKGDRTGRGPFLLEPPTDTLHLENLSEPAAPSPPAQPGDGQTTTTVSPTYQGGYSYQSITFAVAEPFDVRPALPLALAAAALRIAPLLGLALVPGRAPWHRHAVILGGVAAGALLAWLVHDDPWAGLFYGFPVLIVAMASFAGLGVVALVHRRVSTWGVAGMGLAFTFFHAITVLGWYAPVEGGE